VSRPWWTDEDQRHRPDWTRQQQAALFRHNRAVDAKRTSWPAGVLETCERLEREHPGWVVTWLPANCIPGWKRPAVFRAARGRWFERRIDREDPDDLGRAVG
jgi:hypothetical protein